jgi:hypothetical protein
MPELQAISRAIKSATQIRMSESTLGRRRLHVFKHCKREIVDDTMWIQSRGCEDRLRFPKVYVADRASKCASIFEMSAAPRRFEASGQPNVERAYSDAGILK